jgi:hypothetical protein
MRRILLSLPFLMLPLLFALPALAGNWGEDWGTLTWGAAIAAVPSMGKLAVLVLVLALGGLAARFIQRGRAVASLLVIGLVVPMLAPVANAQTVSVPNTFTNGSLADAEAMNENFEALRTGLNLESTLPDVIELTQFTNGMPANADEVNANFTALGEGLYAVLGGHEDVCVAAGGTWDAGTSTCLARVSYDCWVAGFCSVSAAVYPSSAHNYINIYEGDTASFSDLPGDPTDGSGLLLLSRCSNSFTNPIDPSNGFLEWGIGSNCADPAHPDYCGPFASNSDINFGLPPLIRSMCMDHTVAGPPAP